MPDAPRKLFRQKALDRQSSPERLDEAMRVVGLNSWIALTSCALLVGAAVVWAVAGRVPVSLRGSAVLVRPSTVVAVQSPYSGQLVALAVAVGDRVEKGQVLGTLDRLEVRSRLEREREKLADAERHAREADSLAQAHLELARKTTARRRANLNERIAELLALAEQDRKARRDALALQETSADEQLRLAAAMQRRVEVQLTRDRQLRERGLKDADAVLRAERSLLDTQLLVMTLESKRRDLERVGVEIEDDYLQRLHSVRGLNEELEALEVEEALVLKQEHERTAAATRRVQDLQRSVSGLELQLEREGRVESPYSGVILELPIVRGQMLAEGARLATLEQAPAAGQEPLVAVAYFSVGDGKRILVRGPGERPPRLRIVPDSVDRLRYGSLLGTVREVSRFPVTPAEVTKLVGSEAVAAQLLQHGAAIQAVADLDIDATTPSGYSWSSLAGPPFELTAGTTATAWVELEDRSPISFLFPLLREYTGF